MKKYLLLMVLLLLLFNSCSDTTILQYTLIIGVEGEGMVTPAPGTYSFPSGTIVQLEAYPGEDSYFLYWQGDVVETHNPETTIVIHGDHEVVAYFFPLPEENRIIDVIPSNGWIEVYFEEDFLEKIDLSSFTAYYRIIDSPDEKSLPVLPVENRLREVEPGEEGYRALELIDCIWDEESPKEVYLTFHPFTPKEPTIYSVSVSYRGSDYVEGEAFLVNGLLKIVDVEILSPIEVDGGTSFYDLPLPERIDVSLENGEVRNLSLSWEEGEYREEAGSYILYGEILLEEDIINPLRLQASIQVEVLEREERIIELDVTNGTILTLFDVPLEERPLITSFQGRYTTTMEQKRESLPLLPIEDRRSRIESLLEERYEVLELKELSWDEDYPKEVLLTFPPFAPEETTIYDLAINYEGGPYVEGEPLLVEGVRSASLYPQRSVFNKAYDTQDISATIVWGSAEEITAVRKGGDLLLQGEEYDITENTLMIKSSYLLEREIGTIVLTIEFDVGQPSQFTISIIYQKEDVREVQYTLGDIHFSMSLVPEGTFPTGVYDDELGSVEEDFWILQTPVTYELWYEVRMWAEERGYLFANQGSEGSMGAMGAPPSSWSKEPVTWVSWLDTIIWCNALTEYSNEVLYTSLLPVYRCNGEILKDATNQEIHQSIVSLDGTGGFRLPTSLEWEMAARYRGIDSRFGAIEYPEGSGDYWTPGNYPSGSTRPYTDEEATSAAAWYYENSELDSWGRKTQPVGDKPEVGHSLNLYDMSGNVYEWCFDSPHDLYIEDPTMYRVIRGGSWNSWGFSLQIGETFSSIPDHTPIFSEIGFRFVQSKDGASGYEISGQVVSEEGIGFKGVTIYYSHEGFTDSTTTDREGLWRAEVSGIVEIVPELEGFFFQPESYLVSTPRDDLDFVALEEELLFYDDVVFLPEEEVENILYISSDDLTLTFKERSPFFETLELGMVLVSEPRDPIPYGILGRIISITPDYREIMMEEVYLHEVIKRGKISVTQEVPVSELMRDIVLDQGMDVISMEGGYQIPFHVMVGTIEMKGILEVDSDLIFSVDTSFYQGLLLFDLGIRLHTKALMEMEAKADARLEERISIGKFSGTPISVWGPVVFTPEVEFYIGVEGEVTKEVKAVMDWERDYVMGISYSREEGWSRMNQKKGEGFSIEPPELGEGVQLEAFSGVEFSLMAYKAVGAYAGLYGYLGFEGKANGDPWAWEYSLKSEYGSSIGAILKVWRLASYRYSFELGRFGHVNRAYGASGQVTLDGEGLSGVDVVLGEEKRVLTDIDGYFRGHLLQGPVTVTPFKEKYLFEPESHLLEGPRSNANFLATSLLYHISGQVIDEEGQGVEGVTIEFHGQIDSVITKEDGSFTRDDLEGNVIIHPLLEDHRFEPAFYEITEEEDGILFTIYPLEKRIELLTTADSYIYNLEPDTNFGWSDRFHVVTYSRYNKFMESFLLFSLEEIPEDVEILQATLVLYSLYGPDGWEGRIGVYPVTSYWREDTITWNNQPSFSIYPVASSAIPFFPGYLYWDLTGLVEDWYTGHRTNRGINLAQSVSLDLWLHIGFASREYPHEVYRPKIVIDYREPEEGTIVEILELEEMVVEEGTPFDELELVEEVQVLLDDESIALVPVEWLSDSYDGSIPGEYHLIGELLFDRGIINPKNLQARQVVIVRPDE